MNKLIEDQFMKYMAYRMSGFNGLHVVEEVIPGFGGGYLWECRSEPGIKNYLHRTDDDGAVFDTREEAQLECDRLNVGNSFAKNNRPQP